MQTQLKFFIDTVEHLTSSAISVEDRDKRQFTR